MNEWMTYYSSFSYLISYKLIASLIEVLYSSFGEEGDILDSPFIHSSKFSASSFSPLVQVYFV